MGYSDIISDVYVRPILKLNNITFQVKPLIYSQLSSII